MKRYVTLPFNDSATGAYLRGNFSSTQRAIPMAFHNYSSGVKSVTFKILPLSEIQIPNLLRVWMKALRLSRLTFIVLPALVVLSGPASEFLAMDFMARLMWIGMGLVSAQIAAHLLNDFFDHINGFDQARQSPGVMAIRRGWITAHQVLSVGVLFTIVAFLAAGVLISMNSKLLAVILPVAVLTWLLVRGHSAWRKHGRAELVIFLLFGPLLTSGVSIIAFNEISVFSLLTGVGFGSLASHAWFLHGLRNLIADSMDKSATLAGSLGFEGAKRWSLLPFSLAIASFLAASYKVEGALFSASVWPTVLLAVMIVPVFVWCWQISRQLPSSLSSQLTLLRKGVWLCHFWTGLALLAVVYFV